MRREQDPNDPDWDDHLPRPVDVPKGGFRDRMRQKPGIGHAYRIGVFIVGLLFICLGIALVVLPGPLTIPPVILGLWIWSTEFAFAERFFDKFKEEGREAWAAAKRRPVQSTIVTVGGLIGAGVAIWAVSKYDLIDRGMRAVGL
jgi:hypothetical protein